jgi:hypothetical protein
VKKRKVVMRRISWLALMACTAALFLAGRVHSEQKASPTSHEPVPGAKAPDLLGVDDKGRQVNIGQFAGKSLLVNFWA